MSKRQRKDMVDKCYCAFELPEFIKEIAGFVFYGYR
jgi:hypothetical protein